jgi:hypothetical protein
MLRIEVHGSSVLISNTKSHQALQFTCWLLHKRGGRAYHLLGTSVQHHPPNIDNLVSASETFHFWCALFVQATPPRAPHLLEFSLPQGPHQSASTWHHLVSCAGTLMMGVLHITPEQWCLKFEALSASVAFSAIRYSHCHLLMLVACCNTS